MTKSWSFSLTDITKTYNLWNDLITKDPSFQCTSFDNCPFVPSQVSELKVQNTSAGTSLTWNGLVLSGGSWDVDRLDHNAIDLRKQTFQVDTNPTVVYAKISSN